MWVHFLLGFEFFTKCGDLLVPKHEAQFNASPYGWCAFSFDRLGLQHRARSFAFCDFADGGARVAFRRLGKLRPPIGASRGTLSEEQ